MKLIYYLKQDFSFKGLKLEYSKPLMKWMQWRSHSFHQHNNKHLLIFNAEMVLPNIFDLTFLMFFKVNDTSFLQLVY